MAVHATATLPHVHHIFATGNARDQWRSLAERGQTIDARPVSYTHLDVYKRQPAVCATYGEVLNVATVDVPVMTVLNRRFGSEAAEAAVLLSKVPGRWQVAQSFRMAG